MKDDNLGFDPNSLVGPALGTIPKIGPLLSGIWEANEKDNFNTELLAKLTEIINLIENLEAEVKVLGVEISMLEIMGETHQAQANIDTYYDEVALPWLKGETQDLHMSGNYVSQTKGIGKDIFKNVIPNLAFIDSAIRGETKTKWWSTIVSNIKDMSNNAQSNQVCSGLELAYKAWVNLVNLQIKGIMCLRCINYDVGFQTNKLLDNIIQQGIYCQKIVQPYINNDNLNNFTWFGQYLNSSANLVGAYGNYDIQQNQMLGQPNEILTAIQLSLVFPTNAPGNGLLAFEISSGSNDNNGVVTDSQWRETNYQQSNDWINESWGSLLISTDNFSVPNPNQALTGIQFMPDYVTAEAGTVTYAAGIIYNDLDEAGNPKPNGKAYEQNPSQNIQLNWPNMPIAANQYSALENVNNIRCSSPITGFAWAAFGNALGIKLQTSLHQNAFQPININQIQNVAIYIPFAKGYLTALPPDSQGQVDFLIISERSYDATQTFQLVNFQDKGSFGSSIAIQNTYQSQSGEQEQQFACFNRNDQLQFSTQPQNWSVIKPNNIEGVKMPDPNVYNWSTVLLQNQNGQYGQAVPMQNFDDFFEVNGETPQTISNNNGSGGQSILRVDDSSFYFQFIPCSAPQF